jgi:hypothetical protein
VDGAPAFDPGEPYAMADLARALSALTAAGKDFLEALPLGSFFTPQGDRWSPAEHARHLVKSSRPLASAFRLPRFIPRLLYGPPHPSRTYSALRADYRKLLAAGGQAGRFAPSPEGSPKDAALRREQILSSWVAVNGRVAGAVSSWSEQHADGACLPHPLLGALTIREMAAFTVYHTVHHLSLVRERAADPPR